MGRFNKCCCCGVGAVIPRWQNISKARPAGDTGGTHYTATPYPRFDTSIYNGENPGAGCNTLPAGSCGTWLVGGDLNGLSIQEIEDTVDDIMACAGDDTTHATNDHNCYESSGTIGAAAMTAGNFYEIITVGSTDFTAVGAASNAVGVGFTATGAGSGSGTVELSVDMRATKLFGGQWVLAKKFWHGRFGFLSNDGCPSPDPNIAADQTKYRTSLRKVIGTSTCSATGNYIGGGAAYSISGTASCDLESGSTIGQTTGIEGLNVRVQSELSANDADPLQGFCAVNANYLITLMADIKDWVAACSQVGGFTDAEIISAYTGIRGGESEPFFNIACTVVSHTNTLVIITIAIDYTYSSSTPDFDWGTDSVNQTGSGSITMTLQLSDPYNAAECYADFLALLAAWDMSDLHLATFRTDELLALAPLIVYDGVPVPVAPTDGYLPIGMNDYTQPQNGDGSWPQRAWIDPNDYFWRNSAGGTNGTMNTAGGNILVTPMCTGAIIAHTQPGSDRHFWFNYTKQKREIDPTSGYYEWFADTHGAFSESPLPPVTMRWMDNEEAQYDGAAFRNGADPHPGNYPQAFWTQRGGVIRGAKFVQASERWPAVNFGRPCGADKYAVDQPTVCCIGDGDATSGFTVNKTGNAIAPLASGGLVVNDYIVVEADGIYQISGITDNGDGTFAVTVGSKLDDLPTGYNFADPEQTSDGVTHLGRLRFPTASGICGRAAITTAYASGTVTITPAAAQPWLRTDPTTGTILVDVYDASMTLVASSLALTRVSDTSFTIVHAAMSTAVWMTGHGVDWTHYDATSKKTGVHLDWTFDQRKAAAGFTGTVPTWYGGIAGCLACNVTQFTYSSGACPAAIGIVPFYSPLADMSGDLPDQNSQPPGNEPVEQFANQEMFDFPATVIFDDVYGAHWQAAVMLTMPDPFWQQPFKPDCGGLTFAWDEDDGSGHADASDGSVRYYAHHPLVEALSAIPAGMSLPAGVSLLYDPSVNVIAPPYYPTGIPIGDNAGNYSSIEMDWGFTLRVCGNVGGRFRTEYNFVTC